MTDDIWTREAIESPCVKLCVMDSEVRLCIGCHRSVEEITAWTRMTPEARRAVMADLPARARRLAPKRRGGRAARTERLPDLT